MANLNNVDRVKYRVEQIREVIEDRLGELVEISLQGSVVPMEYFRETVKENIELLEYIDYQLHRVEAFMELMEEQYMARTEIEDRYVLKGQ